MKKVLVFCVINVLLFISTGNKIFGQTISPEFFGQNAWMPDSIGTARYNGQLHNKWGAVKNSGANTVRYGGISVDKNKPTNYQYIKMIDSIRANGMEPIIQVPFNNYTYSASQAAAIVKYINITMGRKIKYWVIANEPDHVYGFTTSSQIAPYLKSFSSAMKAVDPSIKIIGPETAWYNSGILNGLTTPGGADDVTGKDAAGRYYVDIISFHTYPFNGTQSRSSVISNLTTAGKFQDNLTSLNTRIANCNNYHNRTGADALSIAVTEANIDYANPSTDDIYGVGANSFVGGQFWAEMMGICMKKNVKFINFWSVIEGSNTVSNIGYLDRTTGNKKPTFYHFQMLAENFKGNYCNGTDNQSNVKAFGSKDANQVAVMIMNQDQASNFNYTVRLDKSSVSGSNPLKINIDAGIAKEYSDVISNQSSTLLLFDASGNIVRKCEYKLKGNADANRPPDCTSFSTTPTLVATITPAGSTSFCEGGSVVLNANTGSGYSYQWYKDAVVISGANSSSYTANASGSYTVKITSGSSSATSSPLVITVTPSVSASVSVKITTSNSSICSGTSVTFTATPVNGGSTPVYQWKKNGVNVGTNSASFSSATLANGDVITCAMTSNMACVSNTSSVSNAITMSVTPAATASVKIAASDSSICSGTSVTFTATPVNGGSTPVYQWKKNGTNVGTNSASFSSATLANGDVITCAMTSNMACVSNTSVTSNAITMSVTPAATASVKITASDSSICSGTSVAFTATPVNGGTSPVYQWKKNGTNVGTNSSSFSSATLANGDVMTCVMTSNMACVSNTSSVSNAITMSVTPAATASVKIAASDSSICSGTSVTFTATAVNGGSSPVYQWKKNGVNVGTNSSGFSSSTLANGDVITCAMTSNMACVSNTSSVSNAITMSVTPTATASVKITASDSSICSGTSVTFTATAVNGGASPVYQWKKNGVNVGTNSSSFSSATLANGDVITCVMTSNMACVSNASSVSNAITMSIGNALTSDIKITASDSIICSGTVVNFSATLVNGGESPTYQWKQNGVNAGTNSSGFSSSTLTNGDVITCAMTSSLACVTNSTVSSNAIKMSVSPAAIASVKITASDSSICSGTSVTFTATAVNGGSTPVYQWKKNGTNVGTNSASFSSATLANGDVITCAMASNMACVSNTPVTSNAITMSVGNALTASIKITASDSVICSGTNVTFTATAVNGGSSPVYQWKKNGTNVGTNNASFSSSTLANGDVITCAMTSNLVCVENTSATSNPITITVNDKVETASISVQGTSLCGGENVILVANEGKGFSYQWEKDNVKIEGATTAIYTVSNPGIYNVIITDACMNTKTSSDVTIEDCPLSGVQDQNPDDASQIKVFPNPTDGIFNIEVQINGTGKVAQIKLMNLAGQVVYHKNAMIESSSITEKVELDQSIAPGTYMLEVRVGKQVYNTKVILMR